MDEAPVLVGVDGSEASKRALRWAVDYATATGAPIEALIAWDVPTTYGMPVVLDDVDLKERAQTTLHRVIRDVVGNAATVTERVEQGHAGDVLVAASSRAGVLVVGAHDHGGAARRLLGSVTLHCVQHAHCPVLVVRYD